MRARAASIKHCETYACENGADHHHAVIYAVEVIVIACLLYQLPYLSQEKVIDIFNFINGFLQEFSQVLLFRILARTSSESLLISRRHEHAISWSQHHSSNQSSQCSCLEYDYGTASIKVTLAFQETTLHVPVPGEHHRVQERLQNEYEAQQWFQPTSLTHTPRH